MKWQKLLIVSNGRVWFEKTTPEGTYKVVGLVECESGEQEPFKVWFEKVDYEPESEVPERETAFFVNTYLSKPECAVTLTARRVPTGDPPPKFLGFCKQLVDPQGAHYSRGCVFSTGELRVRLTDKPLDQGEPLHISIRDRKYGESEGNFVRFAYFAKPFDLIPDPGKVDLSGVTSPEAFADVLKDKRLYRWPLDRL